MICWEQVTHTIHSTANYPSDTFRKPLDLMEEAWHEAKYPELAKPAVNSVIGLWATDESHDYSYAASGTKQMI